MTIEGFFEAVRKLITAAFRLKNLVNYSGIVDLANG